MSEWWTYTVSDCLLFSPRTYWRMSERHNEALWPWHLVALGLGVAILVLLRRPGHRQGRIVFAALAGGAAWALCSPR
jgi:drug/metabolite transporter (DMT)-like permease